MAARCPHTAMVPAVSRKKSMLDRKRVGEGKRVDLGGGRIIKKKKKRKWAIESHVIILLGFSIHLKDQNLNEPEIFHITSALWRMAMLVDSTYAVVIQLRIQAV